MGRHKRPPIEGKSPEAHKETIIVMMRYGGSVDNIATDLGLYEKVLVKYIKKEGLDKKMARRSWTWKRQNPRKKFRRTDCRRS